MCRLQPWPPEREPCSDFSLNPAHCEESLGFSLGLFVAAGSGSNSKDELLLLKCTQVVG